MPRWGLRILDDDHFVAHAVQVSRHIAQGDKTQFTHLTACFYTTAPLELRLFYIKHLQDELTTIDISNLEPIFLHLSSSIREKLSMGLGCSLLKRYREEAEVMVERSLVHKQTRYYRIIILAVALMTFGAIIEANDMAYLRQLVPSLGCCEEFEINDEPFRGPGQRQLRVALDNYQAPVPRSFSQRSCYECGKVNSDLEANTLTKCSGCINPFNEAWFCNEDCRGKYWPIHKKTCGNWERNRMAIFAWYGEHAMEFITYEGDLV